MPIYAYKCDDCGHQKDVLQKISDDPLKDCPACGAPAFSKQLTAAGFQLKGSGWYVTDFRNGSKPADKKAESKADGAAGDSKVESTAEPAKTTTPAPASAPSPQA